MVGAGYAAAASGSVYKARVICGMHDREQLQDVLGDDAGLDVAVVGGYLAVDAIAVLFGFHV